MSANNTYDFADGQLSGVPSSQLFVRNDIFAFKSKKDFQLETEETASANASASISP